MPDPMPDQPTPPSSQPPTPPEPPTEFHIGDEFGTAKRNLPPAGIVLICLAVVAVIVGIFAFKARQKPQGAGSVDFVAAAEVPGQNMNLAAITMTLRNTADRAPPAPGRARPATRRWRHRRLRGAGPSAA